MSPRSLLAHKLGHAWYGDDGPQDDANEARAWRWAADLLITPEAYAAAEHHTGGHIPALAAALDVTAEIIHAYQDTLRRTTP